MQDWGVINLRGRRQLLAGSATAPVAGAVVQAFTAHAKDDSDLTTYTFTLSFGTEAGGRYIVAAIQSRANAARSISSVSIGGVTATELITVNATGSGADIAALYIALVPTGATGDVVVTFSAAMVRAMCSVYRVTGCSPAAADTASDTTFSTADLSASIDCPAGGAIFAAAEVLMSTGTSSNTWTNLTEASDQQSTEAPTMGATSAADAFATAQTGRTITITSAGGLPGVAGALAIASLGPG